jgi:hypothetical protein
VSPKGSHRRPPRLSRIGLTVLLAAILVGTVAVRLANRGGTTASAGGPSPTAPTRATPTSTSPSPGSAPTTPAPSPKRGTLVIHGAGDVNLDPNFVPTFKTHGYAWA